MHPPRFDRARSLGAYAGALRDAVCALKFSRRTMVARTLGGWLARYGPGLLGTRQYDCMLPVPLHVDRLRQRGFNQAVLLARQVSRALGIELDRRSLQRIHPTPPQARLAARFRAGNVRKAFVVSTPRIAGQRVLLIDDVYTSGATADACAATLKRAGATVVDVLTVARAVREMHGGEVRPDTAAHCC